MPRGTPLRCIRVEEELWAAFGQRAEANGTTRTALMRAWMQAYVDEHSAEPDRDGPDGTGVKRRA